MFTRQIKVQIGKSTVDKYNIKGRSADSGGKKNNLSIHPFPHGTRLVHLPTENGRSQSARDGHQSV